MSGKRTSRASCMLAASLGVGGAALEVRAAGVQASPGAVVSTKHNLSTTGPGAVRANVETQVCVFCHTPHNANPAPQLWNHMTSGAQIYGTYGSSSFDAGTIPGTFNTFAGRAAGQPTGSTRLCLSCHDGTIALGSTVNNGTIALGGTAGGFVPASVSLGTDLSNDHPVSFARNPADTETRDPATGDHVATERGTSFVQCVSCHDAHVENTDQTTRKFLVKSNIRSAICTTCHVKSGSGWAWASSPHSTSTKTYTASNTGGAPGLGAHSGYTTVVDNGCESCHRSHSAPQAQRLVKSVSERDLCYQCHGTAPVAQKNLAAAFAKARAHPLETSTTAMVHDFSETRFSPTNFSGARRHVVCSDCHNPHGVANAGSPGTGLHAAGTNAIASASVLAGASGVEPAAWPAPLANNGILPMTSVSQMGYSVSPAATAEYQICFKCHSSYAFGTTPPTSPSGGTETDVAAEFNRLNGSYHPVAGPPHLRVAASNMLAPWNTTTSATRMYCSDCHGNDEATSASVPAGPHGSSNSYLLAFGAGAAWSATAPTLNSTTGLCFNCHASSRIRSTNTVHGESAHQSEPCQSCHAAIPHGLFRPSLIALVKDPAPYNRGAAKIVRWLRAETPSAYSQSNCYSSICHAHNDTRYAPTSNGNTYY